MIERWLSELVATPGLTSVSGEEARRVHLDESLAALETVERFEGPIVDVGSGGGAPGIPLAHALPDREVTLLEATRRKCDFLERWTGELPNLRVVCGRAEEQPLDTWGVAVAKALAPPPVAAELVLPLVAPGGAAILWTGAQIDAGALEATAALVQGTVEVVHDVGPARRLVVLRKVGPTPERFPRRPGIARARPLLPVPSSSA